MLAHSIGDYRRARTAIEDCVELRKAMGEPSAIARALNYRAVVLTSMSEYAEAAAVQLEALDVSRSNGLVDEGVYGLYSLGMIAYRTGELVDASRRLRESLDGWRQSGHLFAVASVLGTLGEVSRLLGDTDGATRYLDESLEIAQRLDARGLAAAARAGLGRVRTATGDWSDARAQFVAAAESIRRDGVREDLVGIVESCAELASHMANPALALLLHAAADEERKRRGFVAAPVKARSLDTLLTTSRAAVTPVEAGEADARGRALTLEDALDLGLGAT